MLPLPIFDYHRPRTLADAIGLLRELGPSACILAGGTDLHDLQKEYVAQPEKVVSLNGLRGFHGTEVGNGKVTIGAGTTLADIAVHAELARLAPRGRVNVVCPGWIVTPMTADFAADSERVRRVLQTIPLRKVGRPHDVAAAVVYLASDHLAGHVSGQVLTVAGGMEGRLLYGPDEVDPSRA